MGKKKKQKVNSKQKARIIRFKHEEKIAEENKTFFKII
jgi:hypothetical protein